MLKRSDDPVINYLRGNREELLRRFAHNIAFGMFSLALDICLLIIVSIMAVSAFVCGLPEMGIIGLSVAGLQGYFVRQIFKGLREGFGMMLGVTYPDGWQKNNAFERKLTELKRAEKAEENKD